ncbi:hypothetical protein C1I63_18405 [Rathayibacter caricis DSM 15933]|uniref:Uncharacterized protein n=1 Tax=Rathayibacter caricis DSM 15933 TaxID=1328867 RepID=A0A2T4UNX6_9MICO|nr:hypothetical protein [Rathayibacter caricis]PTL71214.1 hypothetical protein C1I63_18405 [Rathayibacter caricis DSM 15933]
MSDDDEVGQEVGQNVRIALTIAMQMGEKFARLREELARDAQARSAAQARELSARFDAERGAARATLQVADRPDWWEKASIQDISKVAETAQAWKNHDPIAERASVLVQHEVFERYGVDTAVLRDAAGQAKSELDRAKEWATNSAPEHYHRHDDDRLTMDIRGRAEPDVNAERALITDYRAALAGDAGTLELSAAEEWKRDTDPAGFQDYRVQTSIDWNDGEFRTADPAAVAAARAALVEEWKDTVAPEHVRAGAEVTEAQLLIAEADRLDRANDASAQVTPTEIPIDAARRADELEQQAAQYDRDAEVGGTPTQSPEELRTLAEDARSQVALYRDDRGIQSAPDGVPAAADEGRAAAARSEGELAYDSAERRAHTANAMQAQDVPQEQINARMTMDASFATPARGADPAARTPVPSTRGGRGQGRQIERSEPGR